MSEPTFVGIDIGGTNTRLAIVDAVGRIQADRRCETPADDGIALIEWLGEAFSICREETDSNPAPKAIGVALPGVLDSSRSAVVRAVNLPAIEGLPIRELLVERTGLMTVLDCDTVAGAWGEYCARERRVRRMAYLTIGTGVGGAVLVEGQVLRHTHHSAGHLGHLICDSSAAAPRCGCGVRGCLEAKIAGPALNAAAVEAGFADGIADIEVAYQEGQAAAIHFVDRPAEHRPRLSG
jgi:glucokinase